jgi:hypothetical protein
LQKIAQISGGKFYRILSAKDFQRFKEDLFNYVKTDEIVKVYYKKLNLTKYLLYLLAILLLLNVIFKGFIYLYIKE